MPALELERLSKSFRSQWTFRRKLVVRGLDLVVEEGEVFGFLGPNGAGKTTTIKMMMGLIFPDAGAIRILGRPHRDPRVRRRLGYLPENPSFYDHLTARELLRFHARFTALRGRARRDRVEELLERTGIAPAASRPLRKFSKGMLQRVGLAQALLGEPELVVLDEPQSGLDPIGRRDVRDLIFDLRRGGCTVFFSSHILQDAEMVCDRVGILVDGQLKRTGRLREMVGDRVVAWEVTVRGVEGDLPGELLSRRSGEVLRRVRSEAELAALRDAVARGGGSVVALQPLGETLEEVFLRQVRGEDPDMAATSAGTE